MIHLNKRNGTISTTQFSLERKTGMTSLGQFSPELLISNQGWHTYRIDICITDDLILMIRTFMGEIKQVELYPCKEDINDLGNVLGGFRSYRWGTVSLNNDPKAGYESILLSYGG